MSEASIEIAVPATEQTPVRMLQVTVTDTSGEPLAAATVRLAMEGHGTFKASEWVTEYEDVTDEQGNVFSQWFEFPNYDPRRELKSRVKASCALPNSQVHLVDLHAQGGVRFRMV